MGERQQSTGFGSTFGVKAREPLRITVEEERQAMALANTFVAFAGLDVRHAGTGWEVRVDYDGSRPVLIRVLSAVRDALAGEPTASALVLLDGREYRMQGE